MSARTYWRPTEGGSGMAAWHCWWTAGRGKGGATSHCGMTRRVIGPPDPYWIRPPAMLRCPRCDVGEINEHKAEESLDEVRQPRHKRENTES